MKKLITRFFALNYIAKAFGRTFIFARAANIIFPLFCIAGMMTAVQGDYLTNSFLGIVVLSLLSIAVFFGFFFWKQSPVKWEDLDDNQKWQYGRLAIEQDPSITKGITPDQKEEWAKLDEEFSDIYSILNFYNVKVLAVNFIAFISVITYMFI